MIWSPHRMSGPATLDCDVLVIGSGAGGASVATTICEAGYDVIMLEEGPYLDAAHAPSSLPTSFKRMWRGNGVLAALGPTPVAYAEGRCVGGGTEINSAIFQRAPDQLLDSWAKTYSIADFGTIELKPYYDRAASVVNASPPPSNPGAPTDILNDGARKLGWKTTQLDRGVCNCVGTNFCSLSCPTGAKQSMTTAQIDRAMSSGLRLIADCRVTKMALDGDRVVSVRAIADCGDGRRVKVVIRSRDVFVCAGAVHTPALLRRSGLRRGIGNTLRMHPTIKVTALFPEDVDAHNERLPLSAVSEFMPDRRLGGSVTLPGLLGVSLAEDWKERSWLLPHWRQCVMYYAMVRGQGMGTVRPVPFSSEPMVGYHLTDWDWDQLGRGLIELAQVMFAAGATYVYPSIAGHPGWASVDDAMREAQTSLPRDKTALMTVHLFSSCPPGEVQHVGGLETATDSFGRVHGVSNLVIADGSQIPEAPGVNPQATIMAMAYRSAEAFLARQGRGPSTADEDLRQSISLRNDDDN